MSEHRASIDIDPDPALVFEFLVTDTGMTAWMGQGASLDPVPSGDGLGHVEGWDHFLPRLARAVAGEQQPVDAWTPGNQTPTTSRSGDADHG